MKSYGVTIQMKPLLQYFHMVLFILFIFSIGHLTLEESSTYLEDQWGWLEVFGPPAPTAKLETHTGQLTLANSVPQYSSTQEWNCRQQTPDITY